MVPIMKKSFLLLFFALLFNLAPAHADFDGATIDLAKFSNSCDRALLAFSEKSNQIIFQDAAYATSAPPVFDGAKLIALSDEIDFSDGSSSPYKIAYRLLLASGRTDVVLLQIVENQTINVIQPNSILVSLQSKTTTAHDFQLFQNQLVKEFGQVANIVPLKLVKTIAIDLNKEDVSEFLIIHNKLKDLLATINNAKIKYNYEKYRLPVSFGKIQDLPNEGKVDLDKLRDVVPKLLEMNKSFVNNQSQIPEQFK